MYLASQAYRYKVTQDEEAWKQANNTFWSLHRLYMVTPEANYGLMAKAVMPKGTLPDENWHYSTTPGYTEWMYKSGTSSDDVTSYYYAIPLYIEFVAKTEAERAVGIEMLRNTTDYIMQYDWYLINIDWKPTHWGFWNPQKLNNYPEFYSER